MHAVSSEALFEYGFEKSPQNLDSVILTRVKQPFGKIGKGFGVFPNICFLIILLLWKSCSKGKGGKKQNTLSQMQIPDLWDQNLYLAEK